MKTALKWLFPSNFAYILAQGKHKLVNFSKGHTLIKILMLDFLSLLIVVLENATRLSVQFRKGNNLIWAPSVDPLGVPKQRVLNSPMVNNLHNSIFLKYYFNFSVCCPSVYQLVSDSSCLKNNFNNLKIPAFLSQS